MNIKVDPQAKEYFTCVVNQETQKGSWQKAVGHLITVGNFEFVVAPYGAHRLNVFEKTSGAMLFDIGVPLLTFIGKTLEGTVEYFRTEVGHGIAEIISKVGEEKTKSQINKQREKAIALCGEMPVGEVVDVSEEVSK